MPLNRMNAITHFIYLSPQFTTILSTISHIQFDCTILLSSELKETLFHLQEAIFFFTSSKYTF